MLHRAWLCGQYDGINLTDRQSLLTYCSFASSEADCFGALLNGAALELFDVASRGFIELRTWIDERQITLLHPPVVLFRRYLSTLEGSGLHPSVRLVALAGETSHASDLEQWRRRFATSCALRHRFSSTEAGHIAVACVEPGAMPAAGAVPAPGIRSQTSFFRSLMGTALKSKQENPANSSFVVHSWPTDIGAAAKESAERFPTAPNDPGQRVFHTGDMVRLLDDGKFEFLSRRDNQVKIRGHRVETREIELAFLTLQGVKEAAVIVRLSRRGKRPNLFRGDEAWRTISAGSIEVGVAIAPAAMESSGLHLSNRVPAVNADREDRPTASSRVFAR